MVRDSREWKKILLEDKFHNRLLDLENEEEKEEE